MLLTTITSCWNRPHIREKWLAAIKRAPHPDVCHFLFDVGADGNGIIIDPPWKLRAFQSPREGYSIGHYHNLGARAAETEWIMKLDIDTFPNPNFFHSLIPILQKVPLSEFRWFNAGMFYMNRGVSQEKLIPQEQSLADTYLEAVNSPHWWTGSYKGPAGTNFITRRMDYLFLGGCDDRFRGYGWEDYQQIHMLESCQRQGDPLPGVVNIHNVTQRCRDEISRPKAMELYKMDRWLALLHHWHPISGRDRVQMEKNRRILLECVQRQAKQK